MTTPETPPQTNEGWQGIEGAPRDGTRIRLGHERDASSMKLDGIFPVRGQWNGRCWQMNSLFVLPGGRHGLMSNEPTHWMPLPPAPTPEPRA